MWAYKEYNSDAPSKRPTGHNLKNWKEDQPNGGRGTFSLMSLFHVSNHSPKPEDMGKSGDGVLVQKDGHENDEDEDEDGDGDGDETIAEIKTDLAKSDKVDPGRISDSKPSKPPKGKVFALVPSSKPSESSILAMAKRRITIAGQSLGPLTPVDPTSTGDEKIASRGKENLKKALEIGGMGLAAWEGIKTYQKEKVKNFDEGKPPVSIDGPHKILQGTAKMELLGSDTEDAEVDKLLDELSADQNKSRKKKKDKISPQSGSETCSSKPRSQLGSKPLPAAPSHVPQAFDWPDKAEVDAANRISRDRHHGSVRGGTHGVIPSMTGMAMRIRGEGIQDTNRRLRDEESGSGSSRKEDTEKGKATYKVKDEGNDIKGNGKARLAPMPDPSTCLTTARQDDDAYSSSEDDATLRSVGRGRHVSSSRTGESSKTSKHPTVVTAACHGGKAKDIKTNSDTDKSRDKGKSRAEPNPGLEKYLTTATMDPEAFPSSEDEPTRTSETRSRERKSSQVREVGSAKTSEEPSDVLALSSKLKNQTKSKVESMPNLGHYLTSGSLERYTFPPRGDIAMRTVKQSPNIADPQAEILITPGRVEDTFSKEPTLDPDSVSWPETPTHHPGGLGSYFPPQRVAMGAAVLGRGIDLPRRVGARETNATSHDVLSRSQGISIEALGSLTDNMSRSLDLTRNIARHHHEANATSEEDTVPQTILRYLGTWLQIQLPPLEEGTDLFQHGNVENLDILLGYILQLNNLLFQNDAANLYWNSEFTDKVKNLSMQIQDAFLLLAAGSIISYLSEHAWHLTSAMPKTLAQCLSMIRQTDDVMPTVIQVIPKIRNQLYLTSPERLKNQQSQDSHSEANGLLDILYDLATESGRRPFSDNVIQAKQQPPDPGGKDHRPSIRSAFIPLVKGYPGPIATRSGSLSENDEALVPPPNLSRRGSAQTDVSSTPDNIELGNHEAVLPLSLVARAVSKLQENNSSNRWAMKEKRLDPNDRYSPALLKALMQKPASLARSTLLQTSEPQSGSSSGSSSVRSRAFKATPNSILPRQTSVIVTGYDVENPGTPLSRSPRLPSPLERPVIAPKSILYNPSPPSILPGEAISLAIQTDHKSVVTQLESDGLEHTYLLTQRPPEPSQISGRMAKSTVDSLADEEVISTRPDIMSGRIDPQHRGDTSSSEDNSDIHPPPAMMDAERFLKVESAFAPPPSDIREQGIVTSADARGQDVISQGFSRPDSGRAPRVEITPGAIQTSRGEIVPLVEEVIYLDAGKTLIDGSGRVWSKEGLIDPVRDDDERPILYGSDLNQFRDTSEDMLPFGTATASNSSAPSEPGTPSGMTTESSLSDDDSSEGMTHRLSETRRLLRCTSTRERRLIEHQVARNGRIGRMGVEKRSVGRNIDPVQEEDEEDDGDDEMARESYEDSLEEIENRMEELDDLADDVGLGDLEAEEREELEERFNNAEDAVDAEARENRVDLRRMREQNQKEDDRKRAVMEWSGAQTPENPID